MKRAMIVEQSDFLKQNQLRNPDFRKGDDTGGFDITVDYYAAYVTTPPMN